MTVFVGLLFLLSGLPASRPARADVGEIHALEAELKQLGLVQDSLEVARAELMRSADGLSARIDSFKAEGMDPEKLQEALRAALVLEQRLVEFDQTLETLKIEEEGLRERLRLAYDWEIGVLIQQLAQAPDKGLLRQLVIYQEAREALGDKPSSRLRYGENMAISPDDSPDEIKQKAELMEDIAARLQAEAAETGERLVRLEEEHRLRSRVRIFTTEIRLFDEHLPEGRVLVRVEREVNTKVRTQDDLAEFEPGIDASNAAFSKERKSFEERGSFPPTEKVLVPYQELAREESISMDELAAGDIVLEIRKLKARQQEIHQLEAVVRERARAFRAHLLELLEGNE